MKASQILIFAALAVILGVPFLLRPAAETRTLPKGEHPLVIVTPHVPQIQEEFSRGFDRWHRRVYGEPAHIDWRQPGGTSDILKVLEAHYQAAAKSGAFDFSDPRNPVAKPGACAYDIMLGGGSYEHTKLKIGVKVVLDQERTIPVAEPAGFSKQQLDEWFGENKIGAQTLYDPEQYWLGTALSGFGIVYNKEVLARLGVREPKSFRDMADPRLQGWVTLADPRQSGSAATSLDAILSREGWDNGWRLLREMCANTRSFTNSSPKPPIDVSHGQAAMGLAIDFYGRGQGQAVTPPGGDASTTRVGYVDPRGETYIDADPVTILRGGPNPVLARRFVEFCLSDEGQALWQFAATDTPRGTDNPKAPDGLPMGPVRHELRRMPVRRAMYEKFHEAFIDQVNPFDVASDALPAGWRSALPIMMGAFAIDNAGSLREAWAALNRARSDPAFPSERLSEMESLFYALPTTPAADGEPLAFTKENYKAVSARWKEPTVRTRCEIDYTTFFRKNYGRIVELGSYPGTAAPGS